MFQRGFAATTMAERPTADAGRIAWVVVSSLVLSRLRGDHRSWLAGPALVKGLFQSGDRMDVRLLAPMDAACFDSVAEGVFDNPTDRDLAREFLADPRHHIAVAIDDGVIVGFASAVHYIHPDKPAELWINEVAVAPSHHRRGIGRQVVGKVLEAGRSLGCREAWVLTDRANTAAVALYTAAGGTAADGDTVMFEFALAEV